MREDGNIIRVQHGLEWIPNPKPHGGQAGQNWHENHGPGSLRCTSQARLAKGGTTLAAGWRSEIPPPDVKPGGHWHYLLFYSVP